MWYSLQKKRTTRPDWGRHGRMDRVEVSGFSSRFWCDASSSPVALNGMPSVMARCSSKRVAKGHANEFYVIFLDEVG